MCLKEVDVNGLKVVHRRPQWADVERLMVMLNEFHAESLREHLWMPAPSATMSTACTRLSSMVSGAVLNQAAYIFVDVAGRLSGMGWVQVTPAADQFGGEYAVLGIQILQHARGVGIGKDMMRMLEEDARRLGARSIRLTVADANPAKQLYGAMGYEETGRIPNFVSSNFGKQSFEERADILHMVKRLSDNR